MRVVAACLLTLMTYAAEPGYIDSKTCRTCHQTIYDSYSRTGMGRSFSTVTSIQSPGVVAHKLSERSYSIEASGGRPTLVRTPGPLSRSMDYAIGSGNHSKTYAYRDLRGRLIELPVSWYAEGQGTWAMSPGYDRPDHSDFRREVTDSCLFCHNGYPSEANGGLASGIDCQRCHGPGELHVRGKGSMVNPAKLAPDRRLDVCLQCHLESASRTLPDSIRRFGRNVYSFRPGELLRDYALYFQFQNVSADERISVNGAGFGLLQSQCYLKSNGTLQCTTCHDPHRELTTAEAEPHYTRTCRNCHASSHEATRRDCTGCHMQKRRTEDAVHVVMTDHHIRRQPLKGDLTAMISEAHGRATGPVRPLYPSTLPDTPEMKVYSAMAERNAPRLKIALANANPADAEPYLLLGELFAQKDISQARAALQRARELAPNDLRPVIALAELAATNGTPEAALPVVEAALRASPNEPKLLNALAILYSTQQRFPEALNLLNRAVRFAADDPLTWLNLGVAREATGDSAAAAEAYRRALVLQPDLQRAAAFLRRTESDGR